MCRLNFDVVRLIPQNSECLRVIEKIEVMYARYGRISLTYNLSNINQVNIDHSWILSEF